jgi:hypothetical protein
MSRDLALWRRSKPLHRRLRWRATIIGRPCARRQIAPTLRAAPHGHFSRHLRHQRPYPRTIPNRAFRVAIAASPAGRLKLYIPEVVLEERRTQSLFDYNKYAKEVRAALVKMRRSTTHPSNTPDSTQPVGAQSSVQSACQSAAILAQGALQVERRPRQH